MSAAYQHSARASKANAFCWQSWTPSAQIAEQPSKCGRTRDPNSSTGRMRSAMASGPKSREELAVVAGCDPSEVYGLLKHAIQRRQVRRENDLFALVPEPFA